MVDDIGSEPTVDEHSLPSSTRAWVESVAGENARVVRVERLIGGWTSEMRRLQVRDLGGERTLVLRSFVKPFFVKHAEGLLNREATILQLLSGSAIPAARVIAVDALATRCAFPSLLRTHLPGAIRLGDEGADRRIALLAALLVTIHRLPVPDARRPRTYQAWTRHDVVKIPADTAHRPDWEQAIDVIRQPPPAYEGCFLHRDFHPGNILFEAGPDGAAPRITGVVDWVETSWGWSATGKRAVGCPSTRVPGSTGR